MTSSSRGDDHLAATLLARALVARAGRRRVWLSDGLPLALRRVPVHRVDTPALAEMAVIRAAHIGPRGEVGGPAGGLPSRLWVWFDPREGDRMSEAPRGPRRGRAECIVGPLGWIELRPAGPVVTQLAPGVSARDLQRFCAPPLLIDPRVDAMTLGPEPDGSHDADHGVA
ncbi:MAG: hypothetical protein AAF928_06030 [Myxococcota bacterium]